MNQFFYSQFLTLELLLINLFLLNILRSKYKSIIILFKGLWIVLWKNVTAKYSNNFSPKESLVSNHKGAKDVCTSKINIDKDFFFIWCVE